MRRDILDQHQLYPAIQSVIATYHADLIREVRTATAAHDIVIVGMRQNPFPRRARKLLDTRRVAYQYLEYGSYLSGWRRRLALKMWTGWPTFPMIFIKGMLVGGAGELARLLEAGEFDRLLADSRPGG